MRKFIGEADAIIDSKQRLAIPAKFRSRVDVKRDGKAWVCVPSHIGLLRLYTEEVFDRLSDNVKDTVNPDEDEAEIESVLFGLSERLEPDSVGRIVLPKKHLEKARLGTEVVVTGARNRLEVHDRERWQERVRIGFPKVGRPLDRSPTRGDREPAGG